MNLAITSNDAAKFVANLCSIKWKLFLRRFKKTILVFFILGLLFELSGIRNNFTDFPGTEHAFNWNFSVATGLAFHIIMLMQIYSLIKLRGQYTSDTEQITKRHTFIADRLAVSITDQLITIETGSLKQEINWVLLSHYMVIEDLLVLYSVNEPLVVIERNLFTNNEFDQLLAFVRERLINKK